MATVVPLLDHDVIDNLFVLAILTAFDFENLLPDHELVFESTFLPEQHLQLRFENQVEDATLGLLLRHFYVDFEVDLLLV